MNRTRIVLALFGLMVLSAPFAVVIALYRQDAVLDDVNPAEDIVVVPVSQRVVDRERAVSLQLVWTNGLELLSSGEDGLVTAVHIEPGKSVESGQAIYAVDRVDRYAFATDAPFHRDLSLGDQGGDVAQLQTVLAALGLYDREVDGHFGPATRSAVRHFEVDSLGLIDPSGVFRAAWTVWLPENPFLVDAVAVQIGISNPSRDNPIAAGPPQLQRALVSQADGTPIDLSTSTFILDVNGAVLSLANSGEEVAEGELPALAGLVPPSADSAEGLVRLRDPVETIVVPTVSVSSNPDGDLCVWIAEEDGFQPRIITVGSAAVGTVEIVTGLDPNDQVVANPLVALEDPSCPFN